MFAPISQKIELFSKDSIHSMVSGSFEKIELTLVEELSESIRGEDGFGSTGH